MGRLVLVAVSSPCGRKRTNPAKLSVPKVSTEENPPSKQKTRQNPTASDYALPSFGRAPLTSAKRRLSSGKPWSHTQQDQPTRP